MNSTAQAFKSFWPTINNILLKESFAPLVLYSQISKILQACMKITDVYW